MNVSWSVPAGQSELVCAGASGLGTQLPASQSMPEPQIVPSSAASFVVYTHESETFRLGMQNSRAQIDVLDVFKI